MYFALLGFALAGCLFPPTLSTEQQDAGVNSAPAILAVRSDQEELAEPGPVLVDRGVQAMLNATLFDTDVDDILYLRMYVDYTVTDPTPARSSCKTTASDSPQRSVTCDIKALCTTEDVGKDRFLTIQVFDRMLLDTGTPAFKAMESGGQTTSRFYVLKCQEPSI